MTHHLPIPRFTARFCMLAALLITAMLDVTAQEATSDSYVYSEPSRDGIGKFYMGREIAQVMGHRGAGWLQRPEREKKERTDLLLELLALRPGDIVADIGAGTGYFALPMATVVGTTGQVLAVDIQQEMLSIIRGRAEAANIDNVLPILASEADPMLPANTVDVVLMVDAYHEFSYPREVLTRAVRALKQNGRIVLVEYRAEDAAVPIKRLHKMSVAQAQREMSAVGLVLDQVLDTLPWQHVMVFRRQ